KKGEAQGIIAWHPDRLARNPMDAAQIIYLLDIGKLKDLKFCSYYFDNSPEGKMMLQITLSQSKYSSDKLSKDVKRGMDKKASAGKRPTRGPIGYLNTKTNLKGEQDFYSDPARFLLTKQLWDKMLTGNYSVPKIKEYGDEIGLTQPPTRKLPERPLRVGMLYRTFTNPFYYGWYEWPEGSANWIKGTHEPMVTEEEFDRVQKILGRKGKQKPKKQNFAFTGLIHCPCGGMITADEKYKRQKNGNVHHYIYYHCTKKIDKNCTQKAVRLEDLHEQIDDVLKKLTISSNFQQWALKYLHELRQNQAEAQEDTLAAKQKALLRVTQQIDNLVLKYTSPENVGGGLFTDHEYQSLKGRFMKEKIKLEDDLKNHGEQMEEWVELTEKTFNFARYARIWFKEGDVATKRAIFACLGSDLL
ncbi:MAG: recombinase family protein, partial [Candidatus Uhrbacteria bacterium]|nr:recombinase family protein [Candidatus Uhrbacteria bacterium]